jgi:ketosteroid isomerase-like protein
MGTRRDVHTVPNPSGSGWVNEQGGQVVSRHRRKDTAVEHGRDLAMDTRTEHIIHNQDGRIVRRNSYGSDPFPPRDKNR